MFSLGHAYFYDGTTDYLDTVETESQSFKYFCGKQFLEIKKPVLEWTIVCVDNQSFSVAEIVSGEFKFGYEESTYIPGKHRAGGQSAQRFERARNEAMKHYYKDCANKIQDISGKLLISGPAINNSKLWNHLPKNNYRMWSQTYTGWSGCYQAYKRIIQDLS